MTNNTQLVSVPRELLEASVSIPRNNAEFQSQVAVIEKIRALLAAPAEDVRAVVEEPVGKVLSDAEMGIGYDRKFGRVIWFGPLEPGLLYRHPQRPVVLPERLREVWLFLNGQAELNGCVFGEKPEGRHNFWWRKELRAVLEELYPQQ